MEQEKEIIRLFRETNMYYKEIAMAVGATQKKVWGVIHRHFLEEEIKERTRRSWSRSKTEGNNAARGAKKEQSAHWKGGKAPDGNGYMMVQKPDWYTGRKGSKYIFEHHAVMCESLGLTEMPKGWSVHHIDGNKMNNDLSNLALLTQRAHSRGHMKGFFQVGTCNDHPVEGVA